MKTGLVLSLVAALAAGTASADDAKLFFTLPFCRSVEGSAEVLKPGASEWTVAEEGKFYPLGSSYRTGEGASLVIAFGKECSVSLEGGSACATRVQALEDSVRAIILQGGVVGLTLPGSAPAGSFTVAASGFTVKNPAGSSKYTYRATGDGFEAVVRCVTGSLEVEGRHFAIPAMRAANEFRLRSSHDNLETILYGQSGDYVVNLDCGVVTKSEIMEDGLVTNVSKTATLEWHLSPETRVQINRAVPTVGAGMSVTMMTFDSSGAIKNNFAYAEGRAEVNTGELVHAPKADADEVAKRAAEATTEAAAETTTEETAAEDTESNESNDKKEEE